tara:strand:+ start:3033 stop:4850 length:1818 start_codon:yes stop_codon:yes gene_type:complete
MSTIKHKRGTGDPSASDLDVGELGINTTDGGVFTKTDGGSVVEIGASSGGGFDQDSQGNLVAGTNAGDSFSGTNPENNVLIGENAGTAISNGDNNIALGTDALKTVTLGYNNIAIGFEACKVQTHIPQSGGAFTFQGSENVAIGTMALQNNTIGRQITAIGSYALRNLSENGGFHVAVGANALYSLDGSNNLANTAVGTSAAYSQTTAVGNTILGYDSGYGVTTGSNNVLVGRNAARSGSNDLTTGANNIVIGYNAACSSATVSNEITIGDSNITKFRVPGIDFILKDNGGTPTEGHVLTVDSNGEAGFAAAAGGGLSSDSQGNTVAGDNAGDSFDGTNAQKNTLYGYNAGTSITTGDFNTAIGYNAFYGNSGSVTGVANIGIGYFVAGNLTSGYDNFLAGRFSGLALTEGYYNIAIGRNSFRDATSAAENICIGYNSGADITSAADNTIVGSEAAGNLTTGGNNIVLGHNAQPSSNTVSNEITLGDSGIATIRCNTQTISSLSDKRDKTDINTLDLGLDFVKSLNPVKFKWETRDGNGKDGSYEAGFIAQDFQQLQKENDADYLGLVMDQNPDRLEASYGKLVPILVKAIQELTIEVEKLKSNG